MEVTEEGSKDSSISAWIGDDMWLVWLIAVCETECIDC